ncbi:uncharacterized protein F4822DRAFT_434714 [Hypoxylon trugodes]|uniref:uncharacterized protein n=1 Tax=Hypoxylon trugodes TaxID=326681 RepID=UPI002190D508|nr:uncharacterized protein F4822DRAFT_434714 [Hypoxylon trugodes]KAI1383601.1 hypothetical protein F4822DRAFT_434714 [Hypoxylon trugodes]
MGSRYAQQQYRSVSSENVPSTAGSTLAYDLRCGRSDSQLPTPMSAEALDRVLGNTPKPKRDKVKGSNPITTWLGKYTGKGFVNIEGLQLGPPSPPQPPLHPMRPIVKRASMSAPSWKESSGEPKEALVSNSIAWPTAAGKDLPELPGEEVVLSPAGNGSNYVVPDTPIRRVVDPAYRKPVPSNPATNVGSQETKDLKAERRKGRVFNEEDLPKDLYEFPSPDDWVTEDEAEEYFWEDAGFDDIQEPASEQKPLVRRLETIPEIVITEPDDEGSAEQNRKKPRMQYKNQLSVDNSFEVLYHKQTSQVRKLKGRVDCLHVLAFLVAQAEDLDMDDLVAVHGALKHIIDDRDKLFDLFPLAKTLAKDQKLDAKDVKALHRALKKVLLDRDNALQEVAIGKATIQRLKDQIESLRREGSDSLDAERYVYL